MLASRITPEGEAVVPIELVAGGRAHSLKATIDTAYNGYLTVPSAIIAELELPFAGTARAELGDGREVPLDLYLATLR